VFFFFFFTDWQMFIGFLDRPFRRIAVPPFFRFPLKM